MYIKIYATDKATKTDFEALCKIGEPAADDPDNLFFCFQDEDELGEDIFKFIINGWEDAPC